MRLGFIVFVLAFAGLSFFAHWWLYSFVLRTYPRMARFRKPFLVALVFLFLAPFLRGLVRYWEPLRHLVGLGMGWHLVVMATALPMGVLHLVLRLVDGLRPKAKDAKEPSVLPEAEKVEHVAATVPVVDRPASPERRMVLEGLAGTALLGATSSAMAWGIVRGRFDFQIEEVPIRMPKLPKALDGFTIVQISDIHVGTFIDEDFLRQGLEFVAKAKPDLVAITGDIIDIDGRWARMGGAILGSAKAKYGVVCVPGNHDHYAGIDQVTEGMQKGGIDVLTNRGKVVASAGTGGLAILGVDDLWARRLGRGRGPQIGVARAMVPRDMATVLLAHQPPFVEETVPWGIDLQLSGHTHGGQINPGFSPAHFVMRYVAGLYEYEGTKLYVNRGFGTAGPPARLGAPPEITKIVLVAG